MRHYTMPEKQRPLDCLLIVLTKRKSAKSSNIFLIVFNKTIIPLTLVGYEMIIANSAVRASLAIYHHISNARSWNNC